MKNQLAKENETLSAQLAAFSHYTQASLKTSYIETPIGTMLAIADNHSLHLLEFTDCPKVTRQINRLAEKSRSSFSLGRTQPIDLIETELNRYFTGQLLEFTTPLALWGTPFQNRVWQELRKIPYGKTWSYVELATAIDHPSAFRAAASANGSNPFPIIIPCHRVINKNGNLGGYSSGLPRKEWLLKHEINQPSAL